MSGFREYKVIRVSEGGLSSLFFGASTLSTERIERALNEHARDGWQVVFMAGERSRFLLVSSRESLIITLGR